jgi:hypothetical protein
MSTPDKPLKIHSIDNGFCRVNYSTKNPAGETVFYCLQDEGARYGGVCCYRSTKELEPDYPVYFLLNHKFEVPTGDSAIEITVRKFLTT